jgi:hypothetical protein
MAFLRKRDIGGRTYLYIIENRRRGGKVQQKILQYLGRDPDPKRLKRALAYWGVKERPGKGKGARA